VPVDRLAESGARSVLVAAFDADRLIGQLQPSLPADAQVLSLDAMRIPEARLTNRRIYLDPLNFATNFALFRDTGTLHTRLVRSITGRLRFSEVACWLTLFDGDGGHRRMVRTAALRGAITIDGRQVRQRFARRFAGQLFIKSSARPDTMSSNTRSTLLARAGRPVTAPCPARTTRMRGRPTATPACRRRHPASASSCGCRTAIRRRSHPVRSR
jgi:hypothetical protein